MDTATKKRRLDEEKTKGDESRTESDRSNAQPPPKKLAISLKSKPSSSTTSTINDKTPKADIPNTKDRPNTVPTGKTTVARIFDDSDDSDGTEEMPAECKMRMRNIGRNTPTSAGPNSFRKGKQGFMDGRKIAERHIQQMIDKVTEKGPK